MFDIAPKAEAIASLLRERIPPHFAVFDDVRKKYDIRVQFRPVYDGLEGRIAVVMYPHTATPHTTPSGPCKVLVFGEDSNSDQILVQDWEILDLHGQMVTPDRSKGHRMLYFRPEHLTKAVDAIFASLLEAYLDLRGEPNLSLFEQVEGGGD